jgi:hypothetical protein
MKAAEPAEVTETPEKTKRILLDELMRNFREFSL